MLYRQMQTFLEVANCLNFTAAAKNLGLTQQAVTKQISVLEDYLGVMLFYRTTRTVALTESGRVLRNDFTDINRQIRGSIMKVKAMEAGKTSSCSVGFLSALPKQALIVPLVRHLFETFSDVHFDIKLLDFVELRNHLLDGKLDFCVITSNDWSLWPDVRAVVLQRNPFEVTFSKRHPLAAFPSFELDSLRDSVQLTLPDENLIGGLQFWGKRIPCKDTILCPDISTLLVRLETGEGFALLTRMFDGSDSPGLCFRPIPYPDAYAELVCLCKSEAAHRVEPMIRSARRFFADSLATNSLES